MRSMHIWISHVSLDLWIATTLEYLTSKLSCDQNKDTRTRLDEDSIDSLPFHEKLLGIQRVSNPSTGNQRISTPAHSIVVHIGKYVSSELMIHIKQKGVYGVDNPPPTCFLGGVSSLSLVSSLSFQDEETRCRHREGQISRDLALQFHNEILVWFKPKL